MQAEASPMWFVRCSDLHSKFYHSKDLAEQSILVARNFRRQLLSIGDRLLGKKRKMNSQLLKQERLGLPVEQQPADAGP